MSVRRSIGSPCTCSGDMYASLPLSVPARVFAMRELNFAMPKSTTLVLPVVGDEEVVRRDVAVDEAELLAVLAEELVRGVQPLGGVGDDAAGDLRRHRLPELLGAAHHLAERLAVEVLHGDPVRVLVLAELEDGRDVRVRDARRDARLVEEHVHERLVLDQVRVDALDRDPLLEAARPVHAREVHARHAADANLVDDAVAPEEVRPRRRTAPGARPAP